MLLGTSAVRSKLLTLIWLFCHIVLTCLRYSLREFQM